MRDTEQKKRVEELEADVERLTVELRALRELCVRKKLFTREEFRQQVNEIDAVDGQIDGKVTRLRTPRRGD